jgi:curli production assembly/transport component CsgF
MVALGASMSDFCNCVFGIAGQARAAAAGVAIVLALGAAPAQAGSLLYTPNNPSFGGSPSNGPNLLNLANAQNLPLAEQNAAAAAAAAAKSAATGGSSSLTAGQIFAQQLQSQLLSSFANQITQAIFGPNAQTSGTFSFGTTNISFANVNHQINITINDGLSITSIVVPSLN